MMLKFLLIAIILYLIVRAALNMWAAVSADGAAARHYRQEAPAERSVSGRSYDTVLGTPVNGRSSRPQRRAEQVDEARYEDL